jgi:resuscitation-promoting factor RpfB
MKKIQKKNLKILSSGVITIILSAVLFINLQQTPVTLTINGEKRAVLSDAVTVEQLLKEQGIDVTSYDNIYPSKDEPITANMEISYEKAVMIKLTDGKESQEVWTTSGTVQELLTDLNITLGEWDKVEPRLENTLMQGQKVRITRVAKEVVTEEETIDYVVENKKDATLTSGKKKVVQSGKTGVKVKQFEITYVNGVKTAKRLVDEEITKKPVKEIVAIGTKPKVVQTFKQMPAGETFEVVATAYTALCDSGCTGITATGINLLENPDMKVIAVDPRVIPLGTRVFVEGYGYAIAGDTGGAIKGYKIDLYVKTKDEARKFGRQTVKITILK